MKNGTRRYCAALTLFFLIIILTASLILPASAAASASLSGTSSLRAGDSLTVTLRLNASGAVAVNGTVSFDSAKLTYQSFSSPLKGWSANVNEKAGGSLSFLAESDNLDPIKSESKIISFTFRVKSSLKPGTSVKVKGESVSYCTDTGKETSLSVSAYSATLLAPKSGNADLSSLDIRQTSFMPEFSPDVTKYKAASVPFEVSSLTFDMKTADENAKTEIKGNSLQVGENKVRIVVTAEDGTVKEYSVTVEREQDPNYVPSSDAALSSVSLSEGRLSPAFSSDRREYVIYVPAEVVDFSISGKPRDSKAQGGERVTANLSEGDNVLTYFNRAEDGTEMAYLFHIVRMPAYDGTLPEIVMPVPETEPPETEPLETEPIETEPIETEPIETEPPETEPPETLPPETEPPVTEAPETEVPEEPSLMDRLDTFTLIALGATAAVFLGIGVAIGALAARNRKYKLIEKKR